MSTNYIANVLLPITSLNLNETTLTKLNTFKSCPICNIDSTVTVGTSTTSTTSSTSSNLINNPNLTKFGNFFLQLVVNEFNTIYGTDYTYSDFSINSQQNENDQNSLCTYILTNIANDFTITCYVETSTQIHISMAFDYGDYSIPSASTSTTTSSTSTTSTTSTTV